MTNSVSDTQKHVKDLWTSKLRMLLLSAMASIGVPRHQGCHVLQSLATSTAPKHDNEKAFRVLFLHFEVPTESNEGIASTPNRVDAEEGGGRRGMGLS